MSCAASSTVVSGDAASGSFVIHADTGVVASSPPDAAARSTSRSVRMPARNFPCMTSADPAFARTIAAAAEATESSGSTHTTWARIRSRSTAFSATFTDLIKLGVGVRSGRSGQFLRQQPPQRTRPGGQLRPPHPEQLERDLVELHVRALWGNSVGEILELLN